MAVTPGMFKVLKEKSKVRRVAYTADEGLILLCLGTRTDRVRRHGGRVQGDRRGPEDVGDKVWGQEDYRD